MKRRLGIIIPTLSRGGAERIVSELGLELEGWELVLFVFQDRIDYPWKGKVLVLGIDIFSAKHRLYKLFTLLRGLLRLRRWRRQANCDVTLSLLPLPDILNILTSGQDGAIVSVHNTLSRSMGGPTAAIVKRLISWLYPRSRLIVAVSQGVKEDLIQNFGLAAEQICVIANPVSLPRTLEMLAQPLDGVYQALFKGKEVILSAGRLTQQKGYDILIQAFASLQAGHPDSMVCLLGEGPEAASLEKLCAELDLAYWSYLRPAPMSSTHPPKVVFAGVQSNPFPFMAAAKSFVLPSRWEGFGIVLIEALACGVPVIASDCWSGPREILDPDSWKPKEPTTAPEFARFGILTASPGSSQAQDEQAVASLARAMEALLDDPQLETRLRSEGPLRAKDFALETICQRWEQVFASHSR